MSKCTEIREICGDYAFGVEYSQDNKFTMFFDSLRNAQTVKRCIEVDDSVPNVATAVDFVEVVRCKDCIHKGWVQEPCHGRSIAYCHIHEICIREDDFCSYGERKEQA